MTLAAWSHGTGVVLAVTTMLVYGLVRLGRDRRHLLAEGALVAAVAVGVTVCLMFASRLVLGQLDFIRPTLAGEAFLDHPSQLRQWHSANWRWAPYVAYLLVPPSVIVTFLVSFSRRLRNVATPQLFVGLACAGQFAAFYYLQFDYHVQDLEMHFFSSTLWGGVCLALAIAIAELSRGLFAHPLARWLPALLLVAVPLGYEADPHVPAFGWWPAGAALGAVPIVFAGLLRLVGRLDTRSAVRRVGLGAAVALSVVAMSGSLLVLTVAARPHVPRLGGLATAGDPSPAYAGALGGSPATLVDWYQVSADLPSFVGDPTYQGEQLLMWFPWNQPLLEPVGIFHEGFDGLGPGFPALTASDVNKLAHRRPAELLFMSLTGADFRAALSALGPYLTGARAHERAARRDRCAACLAGRPQVFREPVGMARQLPAKEAAALHSGDRQLLGGRSQLRPGHDCQLRTAIPLAEVAVEVSLSCRGWAGTDIHLSMGRCGPSVREALAAEGSDSGLNGGRRGNQRKQG